MSRLLKEEKILISLSIICTINNPSILILSFITMMKPSFRVYSLLDIQSNIAYSSSFLGPSSCQIWGIRIKWQKKEENL